MPATSCRPGGTVGGPELRGGTGACAIASSPPGDSGYAMGCQFGETSPIISKYLLNNDKRAICYIYMYVCMYV